MAQVRSWFIEGTATSSGLSPPMRIGRIGACLSAVTLVAALIAGCSTGSSSPAPRVTITETIEVPVTVSPSPAYGIMDPELEQLLIEVCQYVADNEPSWDSMQEYGPYEDLPMQVQMVARAGQRAERVYTWAFERLDYSDQAARGNTLYGSVYTDLSNRFSYASTMRNAAESYLKDGSDYQRLYYFWAAYAAAIESDVSGCRDYLS